MHQLPPHLPRMKKELIDRERLRKEKRNGWK